MIAQSYDHYISLLLFANTYSPACLAGHRSLLAASCQRRHGVATEARHVATAGQLLGHPGATGQSAGIADGPAAEEPGAGGAAAAQCRRHPPAFCQRPNGNRRTGPERPGAARSLQRSPARSAGSLSCSNVGGARASAAVVTTEAKVIEFYDGTKPPTTLSAGLTPVGAHPVREGGGRPLWCITA